MAYKEALEVAGAKVLDYETFGDYQGRWLAVVDYNGERLLLKGYYGSCSGCDAFEAEFDYGRSHEHRDTYVSIHEPAAWTPDTCEECKRLKHDITEFGRGYLEAPEVPEALRKALLKEVDKGWGAAETTEILNFMSKWGF